MNKIRELKYSNSNINKTNTSNSSSGEQQNGIFTKITKRYSNVSSKLMLRKSPGRKSLSPKKTSSGSYDFTGNGFSNINSMEIGAPILISSTKIDADQFDINNSIKLSPTNNTAVNQEANNSLENNSLEIPTVINSSNTSSDSSNEIYTDALDSLNQSNEENETQNIKFKFTTSPLKSVPIDYEEVPNTKEDNGKSSVYEVPKPIKRPITLRKTRSKSAQNLHKSELRVYLQKAPSLELNLKLTTADLENCYDLPRKVIEPKLDECQESNVALPSSPLLASSPQHPPLSLPPPPPIPPPPPPIAANAPKVVISKSEPNKTISNENFNNVDNLTTLPIWEILKDTIINFQERHSSNNSINQGSQSSITTNDSSLEDLRSASCWSLYAENPFISIDELDELTRQINNSEEFNNEIDLEYCEHRDSLQASERRITLLKNKDKRLIDLRYSKAKINNAWRGLKNWIGEEHGHLKEVVQKHAAMQRIGINKQNNVTGSINNLTESKLNIARTSSQLSKSSSIIKINREEKLNKDFNSYETSSNLSTVKSSSEHTIVGSETNKKNNDISPLAHENKLLNISNENSQFSNTIKYKEKLKGQNGFEELRRYIKQGGDFGKDLMGILQERVDSEQLYAKSLSKMALKLNKACRETPGTIADAWRGVATEMESRSEVHRQFANSLVEEIVKPLKAVLDSQHKTRKNVENNVDKSSRVLSEWRISEAKAKKASHSAARENEKLQDAMLDVRVQKSPSIALLQNNLHNSNNGVNKTAAEKEFKNAEKDCAKLDNKRKKAEEAVKRADVEYYTLCLRAERARVDWEMSVLRGSSILQNLENIRLINMKNYVSSYLRLTSDMNPILQKIVDSLTPHVNACNIQKDINVVKNIRKKSEGPNEQLLPDFYCEHTTLAMNRERRKHALIKLLQLIKADMDRERRSRNGLKGLSQSLNAQDSQSITDKLYHIRSMLTYLEGARFKLHSALLELDHKPRNSHPLAPHIQVTRDRTGLQQSILKVPIWLKNNDKINSENYQSDNEYDVETPADSNNCVDIINEILIKNFDKNFNRSKSSSEIIRLNNQHKFLKEQQQQQQNSIYENPKSQTLPVKDIDSPGFDRGIADGVSNQPESDFDEFSSQDDDDDDEDNNNDNESNKFSSTSSSHNNNKDQIDSINSITEAMTNNDNNVNIIQNNRKPIVISRCKALYSYTPKLYDELELNPGDIIEVHAKQEDGWWLGALKNNIGIFPATYVEEFI